MNKIALILAIHIIIPFYANPVTCNVSAGNSKKTQLAIIGLGEPTTYLKDVCKTVSGDLSFTHQFDVTTQYVKKLGSKKDLTKIYEKGLPIAVFISDEPTQEKLLVRVYDTRTAKMIKGCKIPKHTEVTREWGHAVANAVLPILTTQDGFFSSKIVYCKAKGKKHAVCITDFDGSHEKELFVSDSSLVAPRWNNDKENPVVLYSEYTPVNVRLMTANLKGEKSVAVNFEGLNMLPAFSEDGSEVVLCLSEEGNTHLYKYRYNKRKKRGVYTRLTHNQGNNISPTLLANGDIVFCSDYETGRTHIYYLKQKDGTLTRLSEGSSCYCPSYSRASHKVAYSQMHKGVAQLMLYDFETGQEKQITYDSGHKLESSWSPCGNYLIFSVDHGKNKRLAVKSLLTDKTRYLTSANQSCSYPSWSMNYEQFPHA
jgi:tol-pal system beta propeller repeat protein TolB